MDDWKDVKVFRLNECDGVAAKSLKEAQEWYMSETGLNEEDAFYDFEPEEMPMDMRVWTDENRSDMQTLDTIVFEYWQGHPFIAFSSEY